MAFDRFLIGPMTIGLETDLKPFMVPDEAFAQLNNAYVFRGRVRKRFGSRLMGLDQRSSRFRIALTGGAAVGITDALGAAAGFGLALTFIAIGSQSSALLTMVSMRAATFFVTMTLVIKFATTGNFSRKEMPVLIFIGAADFLANLLLGIACTKGLVSVSMVFGSLYPIATAVLAFKFLNERLLKVQYFGIALAVAGVCIISAF